MPDLRAVAAPAHPSRGPAEVAPLACLARHIGTYGPATPRNTMMARLRATMSSSARRPIPSPSDRGMVVILSTMRLLAKVVDGVARAHGASTVE